MNRRNPNPMSTRQIEFRGTPSPGQSYTREGVVCTDEPVEVWSAERRSVLLEALPMRAAEIPEICPLLLDHDLAVLAQVGSGTDFRANGGELVASLRLARGNPTAEAVWPLIEGGHLRSISVGYRVASHREIRAGQTQTVAGRTYTAPGDRSLFVAERWRLIEVTLCPIGADPRALIRSLPLLQKGRRMETTLEIIGRNAGNQTLGQFARAHLSRRGERIPENDQDAVRAVFSSVDGVSELAAFASAAILGGYRNVSDSLQGVYSAVDAPNYLLNELGTLSVHPRLGKIARGGVAPAAAFAVSSTGYRLARYGVQFCIDEQDVIDGTPLGIYQLAMTEVGAAARRFLQDLLWALILTNPTLADKTALFDVSRGNTGALALSCTHVNTAMGAIAGQVGRDANDDPVHLGAVPSIMVVAPAWYGAAVSICREFDNKLEARVESRLSSAGLVDPTAADDAPLLTGNNLNWLLAAPGAQAPSIILAALFGRVEPRVRAYSLDEAQWGIGFDVELSVAATVIDGRPLYWSTGG
jgi:hypothetical protein